MTAETLVATLEQDGIRLRTEGGRLKTPSAGRQGARPGYHCGAA